ncbi:GDSL-type esterase/lipase family protein [Halobacillus rhizosphaerae]|uniref:GDSL-type esterase/lipase family protein n=1 Tax=Halobacillus rhizosphaerae TaxID=3064889 RepID=UPI00398B60C0
MKKIICFGDSLTARREGHETSLLTKLIQQKRPEDCLINAGVSGDNTRQAIQRLEEDVLNYQPDLVFVLFGSNDAAMHKQVPIEEYHRNLEWITDQIGPDKVILVTPPPVDENLQKSRSNQTLELYGTAVKEVAQLNQTKLLPFYDLLKDLDYPDILKGVKNDGLHFGEKGYKLLAEWMLEEIKQTFD